MKKILLVVIMGLLAGTVAFADHAQDSLGLGAVFGVGMGWDGVIVPDFYPANLSLKIPNVPLFWGISVKPFRYLGIGITGDYYFFEPNLVAKTATNDDGSYNVKIDWYVGAGFYVNMYTGNDYFGGDGGFRMPFGVSWHALQDIKKLEVSVGSVGGLGIGGHQTGDLQDGPYLHWFFIPVEIAVRWWF